MISQDKSNKILQLILFCIGGTIIISSIKAIETCGPLIYMITLGSIFGAVFGFFIGLAFDPQARRAWIISTAIAGAIGAPLSTLVSTFLIAMYIPVPVGLAVSGLIFGLIIGISQLIFTKNQFQIMWIWVPINSIALAAGFYIAFPLSRQFRIGYSACLSPGWTTVGAIAGLTYGIILGVISISFNIIHQLDSINDENSNASYR